MLHKVGQILGTFAIVAGTYLYVVMVAETVKAIIWPLA